MEERGYAKVNLALHVRERRPDNYHRIETVFAFLEDGDVLSVSPSDRLTLQVHGPFANALEGENLVLRAAEAFRSRFAVEAGASIQLDKRLPVASGIGGGSADAAATLRLLDRWWRIGAPRTALLDIAGGLGADVPACFDSVTAVGTGRGDRLIEVEPGALGGMPVLLVNPGIKLPTGPVFAHWDGTDRGALQPGDPLRSALHGRNDLEPAALLLAPQIGDVLALLRALPGVILARMSGSGATCFALFDSLKARNSASEAIAAAKPAWWCLASRIR